MPTREITLNTTDEIDFLNFTEQFIRDKVAVLYVKARQVEVDSLGEIKRTLGIINPASGNDLILNIDSDLQKKIYDSLSAVAEETGVADTPPEYELEPTAFVARTLTEYCLLFVSPVSV